MSLSQEPAFSNLKNYFVCGFTDITNQSYAGVSGRHERQGQAVNTTNGAGPHNLQLFMLANDGTVLNCLPGYWDPRDLSQEMKFAWQLNKVYADNSLSRSDKNKLFQQMQLNHINQHPIQMTRRSHMQGFDQQYEAQYKLNTSDAIIDPKLAKQGMEENGHPPGQAFKTCDVIMHERMAKRPFLAFSRFDVATFSDYGKPRYDKNEDGIDAYSGRTLSENHHGPTIGDQSHADKITQDHKAQMDGEHHQQSQSAQWGQSNSSNGSWDGHYSTNGNSGWGSNSYSSNKSWGEASQEHKMKPAMPKNR